MTGRRFISRQGGDDRLGPCRCGAWFASARAMWISRSSEWLCSFPNLIEDFRRKCSFVLRQTATVVLLNDIRCVLDCIARLLV
jgi:hypothetical protein